MKSSVLLIVTSILLLSVPSLSSAQDAKQSPIFSSSFNQWLMVTGNYKFHPTSKWKVYSEFHLVASNMESWKLSLIRPAIAYNLTKNIKLSLGYSWLNFFVQGDNIASYSVPEHNIWEEILIKHNIRNISAYHRLRFEERFIGVGQMKEEQNWHLDHFNFTNRFRYRIGGTISGKNALDSYFFTVFDEVFIDTEASVAGHRINQNWIFGGIGKKLNPKNSILLAYHYQWARKSDAIHRVRNHILHISWKFFLESKNGDSY